MDPQLKEQLKQTIKVATRTGRDSYGKDSYGTPTERAARVIGRNAFIKDSEGREVTSSHQLILEATMNLTDRVWLPGEDSDTDPGHGAAMIGERYDELGNVDHVKVWLRVERL